MKKKILKVAGFAALGGLAVAGLASCGGNKWVEPTIPAYDATATDGGKVVNIRVWNDEFIKLFKAYYPGVKAETKALEQFTINNAATNNEDYTVNFITTANKDNAYQDALDKDLEKQASAAANDKIDMFLLEADYALKYVNSNTTVDVNDIGVTASDTSKMYQYTKDVATSNGRLKAVSWQATPGLFAYRADIAREVLGTDKPAEVQEKLKNWDEFDKTAKAMKDKGYTMLSGFDDSYRVFSNNVSKPLVDVKTGKINIDEQLDKWITQTKNYTDLGYNNKTTLWDDAWSKEQTIEGKTFGFFYSTWGINFTLKGNAEVTPTTGDNKGKNLVGEYRVCEGPASYFWGGTWLAAANGSDNKTVVADIMKKMTCDATIAEQITRDTQDYTNNSTAMDKLANDSSYGSEFLGGQNHIALFASAAPKIKMDKTTQWDQGINEKLQEAMKDYFTGDVKTKEEALENFYKKVQTKYPELLK